MNTRDEIDIFTLFQIIKLNYLKIILIPVLISIISFFILNYSNYNSLNSEYEISVTENNDFKEPFFYNFNNLLTNALQRTFFREKNNNMIDNLITKFYPDQLLFYQNKDIKKFDSVVKTKQKFIQYIKSIPNEEINKDNVIEFLNQISSSEILGQTDSNFVQKILVFKLKISETENIELLLNNFYKSLEIYILNKYERDFLTFIEYLEMFQKEEKNNNINTINKSIEILNKNLSLAKNLNITINESMVENFLNFKDNLVHNQNNKYNIYDYNYTYPYYLMGQLFIENEIMLLKLISQNIKENKNSNNQSLLNAYQIIKMHNENNPLFEIKIKKIYNNNNINPITYSIIILFSLIILITLYSVLNFIYINKLKN